MNSTLRAGIYLGVSTDEQAESGLGLASQGNRCRALSLAKGWTIAGLYREEGVSGTLDPKARPEAGRLLADAAAGLLDVVLARGATCSFGQARRQRGCATLGPVTTDA
jgi:DNA invertase Pin-like site-specific DNA recombinase